MFYLTLLNTFCNSLTCESVKDGDDAMDRDLYKGFDTFRDLSVLQTKYNSKTYLNTKYVIIVYISSFI